MPLFKTIQFNATTQILVWKISESYEELVDAIILNEKNSIRLAGMKSEIHQRAFLSVRKLMQHAGFTDFDLYYDEFGKPHLKDGKHISISHSFDFSVIVLSDRNIGIDLELRRDLVKKIARKFAAEKFVYESEHNSDDFIRKLTVIWGVKEAVFKVRTQIGISFNEHIFVRPFEMDDKQTISLLDFNDTKQEFEVFFTEIESYTLVWLWETEK